MKILHIESSSRNCSVAVSDGAELLCLCEEVSDGYKQSEKLHTFVEWALEGAEMTLKELDAISLGSGPGSYTGLRIGAASAKGFCFALDIPLIAVSSLESLVIPFLSRNYDLIVPMIDARRNEVYMAVYDGLTGEELQQAVPHILSEDSLKEFAGKKILIVGDGAEKASAAISLSGIHYKHDIFPSAQYLIRGAVKNFNQKKFEDIAYYEPDYLKEFQGVKMKKDFP